MWASFTKITEQVTPISPATAQISSQLSPDSVKRIINSAHYSVTACVPGGRPALPASSKSKSAVSYDRRLFFKRLL